MTRAVVTVDEEQSLLEVQRQLHAGGFHHVLVTGKDATLVGVLSDRNLLRAARSYFDTPTESLREVKGLTKTAGEAVRHAPFTVETGTTIHGAARRLLAEGISCLPVLTPDDTVAGLVRSSDIMRYIAEQ